MKLRDAVRRLIGGGGYDPYDDPLLDAAKETLRREEEK